MTIKQMKLTAPPKAGKPQVASKHTAKAIKPASQNAATRIRMAAAFTMPPRKQTPVNAAYGNSSHFNPLDGAPATEKSKTSMRNATIPVSKLGSEHITDRGGNSHDDPLSTVIAASSAIARRSALRPKRGTIASAPSTHTPEEDGSAGLENDGNTKLKEGKDVGDTEKMLTFTPPKTGGRTHQNLDGGNSLVNANLNEDDGEFGEEEPTMETGALSDAFDDGYGAEDPFAAPDEELGEGWDTGAPGAMVDNDIEGIGLGDDMGAGSLNPLPPVSVEPDWSEGGEYAEPNMLPPEAIVVAADDEEDEDEEGKEAEGGAEETVALLDADETADDDSEELTVAMVGTTVHAMLRNRIVASLTQRSAVKANLSDVYCTKGFADAVFTTVQRSGLRSGLQNMGFVLATIKPSKKAVVETRIRAGIKQQVAQVQAKVKQEKEVFEQSLAIASVGIRKHYFNGVSNPLAAGLTQALTEAGVIDAGRVVASAFDKWGVPYTKNVFALASKIAKQDENSRKAYIAALDLISDDTSQLVEGDGDDDTIEDDMSEAFSEPVDETTATTAVTAAFSRPGRAHQQPAYIGAGYTPDVQAILNSDAPLTFR